MKLEDFSLQPLYNGVQCVLQFGHMSLSIVKHQFSYGGKQGLWEIAVISGNNQIELPGVTKEGDTVKGFLTIAEVNAIIKKMHSITQCYPIQVD